MRLGKFRNLLVIIGLMLPVLTMASLLEGDVSEGKAAFLKRCKMCHGADGNGNPAMARMLKVEFKPMSSDYIQGLEDSEIKNTVLNGKGKMAAVRGISEEEIEDIIAYLRSLKAE